MSLPTVRMIAPAPFASFQCLSGNSYTADSEGRLPTVASNDVKDLLNAGCIEIPMGTSDMLLGALYSANFNVTTDQLIALPYLISGVSFQVRRITARNASVSLTTAAGGVYTAASKGGTAIVANSQAYSGLTTSTKSLDLTLAANIVNPASTPIYLSLTTAQGAAATADVYVYGELVF
jgi:hypothetical protein